MMTVIYTTIWLALMLGWIFYKVLALLIPRPKAAIAGLIIGMLLATIGRQFPPATALTALLDPVALIIPVLLAEGLLRPFGYRRSAFPKWEILLFLALWIGFITLSTGVGPFDPYRLGYQPLGAGGITAAFIIYGVIRKNLFLPLLALAAQIMWAAGIGSSNYFDHIQHFLLLPVLLIALLPRRKNPRTA